MHMQAMTVTGAVDAGGLHVNADAWEMKCRMDMKHLHSWALTTPPSNAAKNAWQLWLKKCLMPTMHERTLKIVLEVNPREMGKKDWTVCCHVLENRVSL